MVKSKPVSHSRVIMATVIQPQHANPAGNAHGGEIMKLMDTAAGVVAKRHARANAVTARVDEMQFHHPIFIGNLVTCYGNLTFVGKSSMEISITVTVEDLSKDESVKTALTAYFTFVSLKEDGTSQQVPSLEIITEEERRLFEDGQQRYLVYRKYREKNS